MTKRRATPGLLVGMLVAALYAPLTALAQDGGKVEFDRTGYRFTSLGERKPVSARVVDARRKPVPNRPIAYRTSDPAIAVVTPTGVVQSRRVGRTRLWAVSGTDSSFALIVVDQWARTFSFAPNSVTFDAIGAMVPLDVQLRDSTGNAIPSPARRTALCRPRDDKVVTLLPNGRLQSKANGVTWVRCADRGIADSVRVEVRQRPARVIIVDKLQVGTKTAPTDTFRLRMRAFDSKGDSIPGARGTWASLNPSMVSVEPISGFARAIGPGTARVVAQLADATDTLTVTIGGTAATGFVDPNAAAESASRIPKLSLNLASLVVGDTQKVTVTAADAFGAPISNPENSTGFTSTNDSVVKYIGRQRVVAVNTGVAFLIARLSFGGTTVVDSISVRPIARATGTGASGSATDVATRPFVRPTPDTTNKLLNPQLIAEKMKAIIDSGIGKTTTGRSINVEGIVADTRHATQKSTTESEARNGIMFGALGVITPTRQLAIGGSYKTGTLSVKSGNGEDMSVTEIDANLTYSPFTWFGLSGGYLLRGERTKVSLARWTAVRVTTHLRGSYLGDIVSPSISVSFFPIASLDGSPVDPLLSSLAAEAGLDLRFSAITAGIRYYVEAFKFPPVVSTSPDKRTDQFSQLRIRFGAAFGR